MNLPPGCVNLLYLALPIYTSQVYDRVISSGNMATLVMLTIAFLLAWQRLGRWRPCAHAC